MTSVSAWTLVVQPQRGRSSASSAPFSSVAGLDHRVRAHLLAAFPKLAKHLLVAGAAAEHRRLAHARRSLADLTVRLDR
jgi:hypothetical protein